MTSMDFCGCDSWAPIAETLLRNGAIPMHGEQTCKCDQCKYYVSFGVVPPFHKQMSSSWGPPSPPCVARDASMYTHNPYKESASLLASAQSPPEKSSNYPTTYGDLSTTVDDQFTHLRGSIAQMACTVRGRAILQSVLRQHDELKTGIVFDEIITDFYRVATDLNGTHVARQLMEVITEKQLESVVDAMSPDVVVALSTFSQHSRRIIQSLFESHKTPALDRLVAVLSALARDLAVTQQGCITIMRVLEHSTDSQKEQLMAALQSCLVELAHNPFGNYVVQAFFAAVPRDRLSQIIERSFGGFWVQLSRNKFGSNVMEKVVHISSADLRRKLVDELVMTSTNLQTIMHDSFGNFVLQAIIDTCESSTEYQRIAARVRSQLPTCPYGHKIEAKLRSKRLTN